MSPDDPATTLLLLGRRRGALAAARRLGLEVLLLAEGKQRRPAAGVAASLPCDFSAAPDHWLSQARRICRGRRVAAVVAAAERTVYPAAWIRRDLGIPGMAVEVARRVSDKLEMKRTVAAAGVPVTDFASDEDGLTPAELLDRLGSPVVIKPRRSSGGRGQRLAATTGELAELPASGWIAERFVRGAEMSVEGLISEGRERFVNLTEYLEPRWASLVPAELDPATAAEVVVLHRRAVAALGLVAGITHLELFVTRAGALFGEIAARPPGGHLMEMIERVYGFDPWRAWLEIELGREPTVSPTPRGAAAARILHPGPGILRALEGTEAAAAVPGVRLSISVAPGARIGERLGTGQEVGHLLVAAASRTEAARRLAEAHGHLHWHLDPAPRPAVE